ncbi:MAG: lipopolysaccharide kinase InaA family protein [Flavobacteriaceae bacterium]|nr:lipopolysaccharide kinase InaA family protein [Flavobacteriaceae bacterium]
MIKVIQEEYVKKESLIDNLILNFEGSGLQLKDARNKLKIFLLDDVKINIKSFKIPNLVNQIIYRFVRKGKAQRSFEYAKKLHQLGINTPSPIAYYEQKKRLLFKRSFYVSEHLNYDLTYRDLITDLDYPNREVILRNFTRFTFELHEKHIHFLDHSPGNTLIQITPEGYKFFLVDLNRMRFRKLSFEDRIKNFARLSKHQEMIELMSDEYSKLSGESYEKVVNLMKQEVATFRRKIENKSKIKRLLSLRKIS